MQPAGHLARAQPYDVFMSLGGPDREPVRELVRALRKAGLTVFLDEDRIPLFVGVTAEIEAALRQRTDGGVLLASYPSRMACQFELTAAYLAGLAEGDPSRRIVVINPELGTDHLQPVELADDRFAVLPAPGGERRAMAAIVMRIQARVDAITGGIGGVPFSRQPVVRGTYPRTTRVCRPLPRPMATAQRASSCGSTAYARDWRCTGRGGGRAARSRQDGARRRVRLAVWRRVPGWSILGKPRRSAGIGGGDIGQVCRHCARCRRAHGPAGGSS